MPEEDLRDLSNAVFGNRYFLEVSAAVGAHPKIRFIQKDLVQTTGIEKGLVATVVKRLEVGLLITRLPRDGREQPFERHDSPLWAHLIALRDELESN